MPMSKKNRSATCILVVSSDAQQAIAIIPALVAAGYAVGHTTDGADGLIMVEQQQPALVLLEWGMPLISGAVFTRALHAGLPAPPPALVQCKSASATVRGDRSAVTGVRAARFRPRRRCRTVAREGEAARRRQLHDRPPRAAVPTLDHDTCLRPAHRWR